MITTLLTGPEQLLSAFCLSYSQTITTLSIGGEAEPVSVFIDKQ
ncbi:hypothetical protein HMPREF1981_01759 [Bacteroides pyogenes F0041]|uniref:Uncharacterized protein n=1 Tax=Bacteroides pyogenes F0041 TaxID=1321819 RepID=U2CLI7_9BACE|nr:hypothetical protein HMPREF1981_01759 [Bacteroides pyogenes F0041]